MQLPDLNPFPKGIRHGVDLTHSTVAASRKAVMAESPKRKGLRTGCNKGGGKPPGFKWSVRYFTEALGESRVLTEVQHAHIVQQLKELARQKSPSHPETLDVKSIEDFHELRDKGGVLGRINFRVYFYIDKDADTIVVLGCDKKEEDGQTSLAIKVRMRNRLRRYLSDHASKRVGVIQVAHHGKG